MLSGRHDRRQLLASSPGRIQRRYRVRGGLRRSVDAPELWLEGAFPGALVSATTGWNEWFPELNIYRSTA
jgi:hypothetical protein